MDEVKPVLAAFDLDGTLTSGGSVFKWLRFVAGNATAYSRAARLCGALAYGAIQSGPAADRAKEQLFRALLTGRNAEEVKERSREFVLGHLEGHERPNVTARLRWHQREGHDVVIVSASPEMYVGVVAEYFSANDGIGTRLGVDIRGELSGTYLGKNCRGPEKLRRLQEWIEENMPTRPTLYAYGNSRGDKRILSDADFPFDVGRLGPFGALRSFARLSNSD